MSADVASLPASYADLAREIYWASKIHADKPQSVVVAGVTRTRKPGNADDIAWSNFAYGLTYPKAAEKIAAGDLAGAEAWKRIRAYITAAIYASPTPSPSWNGAKPTWPLPTAPRDWSPGSSFAYRRPFSSKVPQTRYHIGVDLDAAGGTPVLAPESGVIINPESGWETVIDKATGKTRGVKAVLLQTDSGLMLLLGGTQPGSGAARVKKGQRVVAGQELALVGWYPGGDSMLHFSAWESDPQAPLSESQVNREKRWDVGGVRPPHLVDPSDYLKACAANPKVAPLVGFVDPKAPNAGAAVTNDVEGGELFEGVEDAEPLVTAADGRTSKAPCLAACARADVVAWWNAAASYRKAAIPLHLYAFDVVKLGWKWTPAATAATHQLAAADKYFTQHDDPNDPSVTYLNYPTTVQQLVGVAASVRQAIDTLTAFVALANKPPSNPGQTPPSTQPKPPGATPTPAPNLPAVAGSDGGGAGLIIGGFLLVGLGVGVAVAVSSKKGARRG